MSGDSIKELKGYQECPLHAATNFSHRTSKIYENVSNLKVLKSNHNFIFKVKNLFFMPKSQKKK